MTEGKKAELVAQKGEIGTFEYNLNRPYPYRDERFSVLILTFKWNVRAGGDYAVVHGLRKRVGGETKRFEERVVLGRVDGYGPEFHEAAIEQFLAAPPDAASAAYLVDSDEDGRRTEFFCDPPFTVTLGDGAEAKEYGFAVLILESDEDSEGEVVRLLGLTGREVCVYADGTEEPEDRWVHMADVRRSDDFPSLEHQPVLAFILGQSGYVVKNTV